MQTKKGVSATVAALFMLGMVPFALAQQSETEAERKLKVLEEQIQTLEAKTALKENAELADQKEWNAYYDKVRKQLEAWDDYIDETHGVKK